MDYSGFIYLWTNEIDGKKYLGSHLGTLDDGYIGSGERFLRAVNKYGIENFSREIIEYVKDEKNIRKREQYYLDFYKVALDENFYNISQSACGGKIWQYFDEEKRKEIICRISESNTGSWEDRFGKKEADRRKKEISKRFKGVSKTEEHKRKIGERHKGKEITEETRKKMSEARKGKKDSEETKLKKSESLKGRIFTDAHRLNLGEAQRGEKNHRYGKSHSEESRKFLSENMKGEKNPFYGKSHSEETRKKISETKKRNGKSKGRNNPSAKSVVINGIKYDTQKEAMKILNLSYNKLQKIIKE